MNWAILLMIFGLGLAIGLFLAREPRIKADDSMPVIGYAPKPPKKPDATKPEPKPQPKPDPGIITKSCYVSDYSTGLSEWICPKCGAGHSYPEHSYVGRCNRCGLRWFSQGNTLTVTASDMTDSELRELHSQAFHWRNGR